jgi:hypothetical protein
MAWEVEYGTGTNGWWYWRLIDRSYSTPWIAAEGGGGHPDFQVCMDEINKAKQELYGAPLRNVGQSFS